MSTKLNRQTYEQLIRDDLAWLRRQPDCPESDHIIQIVADSVRLYYPPDKPPVSAQDVRERLQQIADISDGPLIPTTCREAATLIEQQAERIATLEQENTALQKEAAKWANQACADAGYGIQWRDKYEAAEARCTEEAQRSKELRCTNWDLIQDLEQAREEIARLKFNLDRAAAQEELDNGRIKADTEEIARLKARIAELEREVDRYRDEWNGWREE